ncbi:MAG: carboxylating nicotinate-nucleotide diphosphorylase [Thiohalocapsa sp.]|jgi:nicotinate-nucleotide pyrophosphorylase (carboxylating)|uniref:carboxylating nicotinate-nucleotide diphosphorylase n=1 Tax=Thiohalocapsa sp. TaxID=2497641 RepID=UPI0025F25647|nr:carboxylating nicotinate-nucleotide diphosphorylase [Thiohalocapsa sp.]MCG6943019.1 carboxylating nicotinate-nucleotide diphosphorylase [Thiohalocapsa sp.]
MAVAPPNPPALAESLPPLEHIRAHVQRSLDEDVGSGDLTAALLPATQWARAEVVTREPAVLCGRKWFELACTLIDARVAVRWLAADGDLLAPGALLCQIEGPLRALLTAERTALNYLQTLSGTATRARRYADAVAGLPVRILDTRKTLPGLRREQKYAVRCGGCHNHRMGLFDAVLIKENHITAAGSIAAAVALARQQVPPEVPVEIEVETLAQLEQALDAGVERVLLDNFELGDLRRAVSLNQGRARLEASGGVTLEQMRGIAETGVDDISVGDLTKSLLAADLSMRLHVDSQN